MVLYSNLFKIWVRDRQTQKKTFWNLNLGFNSLILPSTDSDKITFKKNI